MDKKKLIGMNLAELQDVAYKGGMPRFVGRQLAEWIYAKGAVGFDEMVNISKKNKQWLSDNFEIGREAPVKATRSADGTVKYLFAAGEGRSVESVYIPDHDRATLCVSSQVGCKMNCYFCATGKMGFKANLDAAGIINQILSVPPRPAQGQAPMNPLTNVVFMGMGEPLDNLDAVLAAIDVLTASWGLAWSPKRITVSTVGYLPALRRLLDESKVHVALSVHTPFADERAGIMPAEKAWPVAKVVETLRDYDFAHQRRLSVEYTMWSGINDDMRHADALARLLRGTSARANLIRYHALPDGSLRPASQKVMEAFRDRLNERGITATIRASRGEDIDAACGMLAGKQK